MAKTDGLLNETALDLNFIAPKLNELSPEAVPNFMARHPDAGVNDAASLLRYIESRVTSANISGSLHHASTPKLKWRWMTLVLPD